MQDAASKIELVIEGVLARLRNGTLRAGDRLRSIREEATVMGVAKNTVVEAYLRLVAQGVVTARPGAGYYVSRTSQRQKTPSLPSIPGIARRSELLTEQLERRLPIRPGDGRLPSDWLESSEMRRPISVMRVSSDDTYNTAWGLLPLRERLCSALAERSIQCHPGQVLMTYGGNHAMDLIIRCYVRPGDAVLVDDPGYYPLFWKLNVAGARIVGVRRLHDGPDLADLNEKARTSRARLFFTQSLAHNPTGGSLSQGNAYGVLKIAEEHDMLLIEDDPFADILPVTAPRLAALDQLKRVIYIGSFSKTLPGSVRVGYVAAAQEVAEELNEMKVITIVSTSAQNERLVYSLIEGAHYLKFLRRLRERIHEATAETVKGLEKAGLNVPRPLSGGYYVWVQLPQSMQEVDLPADAARAGIFIAPSEAFATTDTPAPGMRVNVAYGSNPLFLEWLTGWRK
ncbi:PLP-dependent aminotransferase family protein [Paraburkholderia sp. A2RI-6]|uniref:aminotransferase-like domain-containing protein n=1 Tax=Paraburkholderia sp. A2RI-6 TaxID=3028371 RepID=UPI003B7821C3